MQNEIVIRQYDKADWRDLSVLLREGYNSEIDEKTLETEYLGDQKNILVAECDNRVVGTIFWEVQRDYVRPHKTLYLTYLVVKTEYRRKGIARKIYSIIEDLCREQKCDSIEFTSANYRTGAHALYMSLGYSIKDTSVFIKEL